jgi:hypothetical protein
VLVRESPADSGAEVVPDPSPRRDRAPAFRQCEANPDVPRGWARSRGKEEKIPAGDQTEIRTEITVPDPAESDVGVAFPDIGIDAIPDPDA